MPSEFTFFRRHPRPALRPLVVLQRSAFAICTLVAVSAEAVAPAANADPTPRIFLSFAADREQIAPDDPIVPSSPFTFFVLVEGSGHLSAWEVRVAIPPEVVIKRRTLPGKRNVDVSMVEDHWIVGLGACVELTAGRPFELVRYEGVLLSKTTDAAITLLATDPSSLGGQAPAWADCARSRTVARPFAAQRGALSLTTTDDPALASRPGPSALFGATPNPFNPSTRIYFRLASSEGATLRIYNLAGRLVRTFDLGGLSAGEHDVVWNGCDESGSGVASAVYLVRLEAADQRDTVRIVLLK